MRCRGEQGGATVLVLVVVAVLAALALAGVVVGGVLVGQRRAAGAADLAALAAAEAAATSGGSAAGGAAACEAAGRVGEANGARLTGCVVEGLEVVVEVEVDVPTLFDGEWGVPARARAGPDVRPADEVARGSGGPAP